MPLSLLLRTPVYARNSLNLFAKFLLGDKLRMIGRIMGLKRSL
jgi:hypothetical protein